MRATINTYEQNHELVLEDNTSKWKMLIVEGGGYFVRNPGPRLLENSFLLFLIDPDKLPIISVQIGPTDTASPSVTTDPATAIGVVAGIFCFVTFGTKLIQVAIKIHDAQSDTARDASKLSGKDKSLCLLAEECHALARQLLELLNKVKPKDKSKRQSLWAALKSGAQKKDIEDLEKRLGIKHELVNVEELLCSLKMLPDEINDLYRTILSKVPNPTRAYRTLAMVAKATELELNGFSVNAGLKSRDFESDFAVLEFLVDKGLLDGTTTLRPYPYSQKPYKRQSRTPQLTVWQHLLRFEWFHQYERRWQLRRQDFSLRETGEANKSFYERDGPDESSMELV
ncbi:hypothetical protein QBC38DRAFT_458182 [Podospora fimiseda]|uniref:Uncharacterized protein n=1 Tax=Podospora fimiseda TaxID=252190 RepID=A0AAN7BJM7_9PEZI|nr:hypothetical protein QBC38DRAFT_458182 [Podospora fimiseda]